MVTIIIGVKLCRPTQRHTPNVCANRLERNIEEIRAVKEADRRKGGRGTGLWSTLISAEGGRRERERGREMITMSKDTDHNNNNRINSQNLQ